MGVGEEEEDTFIKLEIKIQDTVDMAFGFLFYQIGRLADFSEDRKWVMVEVMAYLMLSVCFYLSMDEIDHIYYCLCAPYQLKFA